jgi:outer membrane assembly lipoprotein YfiO
MKVAKSLAIGFTMALTLAGCGGGDKKTAKTKVAVEEAKPGRDNDLFQSALKEIQSGHEDSGRMELNTILNTYSDSPLVKASKLAMSDSFYIEGGSKNLAQAKAGYQEFLEFFPNDPLTAQVMLKIAEIDMRQVISPDRDTTHARQAERELKEILRLYPNSDKKPEIEARIKETQEYLAMHEMKVARFYADIRQAPQAAQMRTEEILKKYPNFSRMDEALFYHAKAMAQQEDTETASQDLTRLLREYPHSTYTSEAKKILQHWSKPIPDPDPQKVEEKPADSKPMVTKFLGFVMGPKVAGLSNKGVIVDTALAPDKLAARALELSGTKGLSASTPSGDTSTNAKDSRPRRSTQAGQDVEVKGADQPKDDKKQPDPNKPPSNQ